MTTRPVASPPTRLIINADDFGFSAGVTDGILEAHAKGILTSTTLMTTMPDCDRAIALAKATPTLGVGIHLSLTQGKATTHCDKILAAGGEFPRSVAGLARRLLSPVARRQAFDEFCAQVEYALARGLVPTHLDSHKHIAHLPMLREALLAVAERYHINRIRTAREIHVRGGPRASMGYGVLRRLARRLARAAGTRDIRTTDWFFGLAATGHFSAAVWQKLLTHLPKGTGEIMVHPGRPTGLTEHETRLLHQRAEELAALVDPAVRAAVTGAGVELIHYGQI